MNNKRNTVIAVLTLLAPASALAVPAWSRSEGTSCSTCHATPTWQLTNVGLDFIKNGHRTEATSYNKSGQKLDNYISFLWKYRAFNDRPDDARTGNAAAQKPRTNFEQHSFALYTGGPLSERFSYFTEIYLSENTGATSGTAVTQGDASRKKLAEAFLQYNHPLALAGGSFLAVRVGEIVPAIVHVFGVGARSAEQRSIPLNDSLAGNTNSYRPFSRQQGLDATLNAGHFEGTVGLVNGSDTATTNSIDADNHKDWFVSALMSFDENESAAGVFHYDGKFSNYTVKQDFSTALLYKNDFYRTGLMGRFLRDNWRLVGTYWLGEETVNAALFKAKNRGYYGLIDFNLSEKLGAYLRYDHLDPNTDLKRNETSMVLFGLNGLLYANLRSGARWQVEYSIRESYQGGAIMSGGTTKYQDHRLYSQVTWGF